MQFFWMTALQQAVGWLLPVVHRMAGRGSDPECGSPTAFHQQKWLLTGNWTSLEGLGDRYCFPLTNELESTVCWSGYSSASNFHLNITIMAFFFFFFYHMPRTMANVLQIHLVLCKNPKELLVSVSRYLHLCPFHCPGWPPTGSTFRAVFVPGTIHPMWTFETSHEISTQP